MLAVVETEFESEVETAFVAVVETDFKSEGETEFVAEVETEFESEGETECVAEAIEVKAGEVEQIVESTEALGFAERSKAADRFEAAASSDTAD